MSQPIPVIAVNSTSITDSNASDADGDAKRKNLQIRSLPVAIHFKATIGTDFVGTILCQRFLRNVTITLGFQFLLISAFLIWIICQAKFRDMIRDKAKILLIINGPCFLVIALVVIFFNRVFRKIGVFNYIPLVVVTVNIAALLGVASIWVPQIVAVTLAIAVHCVGMVLCQVVLHWEPALPSGLLSIILGNSVFGAIALASLKYGYKYTCPAEVVFIIHVVTALVFLYILYDLELMTTVVNTHKLLKYGVLFNGSAYATLHLSVDFLNMIGRIPLYFYVCCKERVRTLRYSHFVPRSCLGMGCGKVHQHGEHESDPEDDPDLE